MALRKEDREIAKEVTEIRKFEVDRLEQKYIEAHITRLKSKSKETTESSSRHMEMLTAFKRFNSLTNRMAHSINENFSNKGN
jgi:Na+/phosphate symporter